MIQDYPETDLFKKQMRESLQRETRNSRAIKIPSHENVYTIGEHDEMIYFIQSGQVKLSMTSSEGRECLLAIHGAGDVFGELCLSGLAGRLETAKISHEELSNMIGTTRPRVSVFMQRFRNLGLLEITEEHYLIVMEDKLTNYLASIA